MNKNQKKLLASQSNVVSKPKNFSKSKVYLGSNVFLLTRLISEASYVACPRVRPHDTPIFLQAESNISCRVPVVSVGLLVHLFEGLTIDKLTVSGIHVPTELEGSLMQIALWKK